MIYRLTDDYINTCSLLIDNVELGTKMPTYRPRFFAQPRAQEWVTPKASFFFGDSKEEMKEDLPDVTTWSTGVHFGQTNVAFDEKFLASENISVFKSNTNKLLYSFLYRRIQKRL